MVNTFLTFTSFKKTAQNLNNVHLRAQIKEGYQIRRAIESIWLLADWYQVDVPKCPYDFWDFRLGIIRRYNKESFSLVAEMDGDQVNFILYDRIKGKHPKLRAQTVSEVIESQDDKQVVLLNTNTQKKKTVPMNNFVPLNKIHLTMGYCSHPAVAMWVHHIPALEYYINCCLDEFESRGLKMKIPRYQVQHPVIKPEWASDDLVLTRMRSNLIRKEREAAEKKSRMLYHGIPEEQRTMYQRAFKETEPDLPYFWPYSKNYDSERRYLKGA